jgi:hypothetical protein
MERNLFQSSSSCLLRRPTQTTQNLLTSGADDDAGRLLYKDGAPDMPRVSSGAFLFQAIIPVLRAGSVYYYFLFVPFVFYIIFPYYFTFVTLRFVTASSVGL